MIAKLGKNKKRKKDRSILFSIVITILLLLTVSFLIVNNVKTSRRRAKLNAQIKTLTDEIQQAEKKKKELESRISQAGSAENIEKIARDQLGLKKPGEEVVVVKKKQEENSDKSQNKEKNKSWWELIKSIFSR